MSAAASALAGVAAADALSVPAIASPIEMFLAMFSVAFTDPTSISVALTVEADTDSEGFPNAEIVVTGTENHVA